MEGKITAWFFCLFCHLQNSKRMCIFKRTGTLDFSLCYSRSNGYFPTPSLSPHSSKDTPFSSSGCLDRFPFQLCPFPYLYVTRAVMPQSHSSPTVFPLKYLPLLALQLNFFQPFKCLVFFHVSQNP